MFLMHLKIFYLFRNLLLPTMYLLNFIHSFFIKDQATWSVMFRVPFHGGLYPLVPPFNGSFKHAFITIKLLSSTWHQRLGHPSSFVVLQQILRKHNLSYAPEVNLYVCTFGIVFTSHCASEMERLACCTRALG
jgi:hypothetical protein